MWACQKLIPSFERNSSQKNLGVIRPHFLATVTTPKVNLLRPSKETIRHYYWIARDELERELTVRTSLTVDVDPKSSERLPDVMFG